MARADNLGIYVSVPFCASKCTYCNFASDVFARDRMAGYVGRLAREIAAAKTATAAMGAVLPRMVDTIYFGGGTPSLLPPELFREIAISLRTHFEFDPQVEWTVECAPAQLSSETLAAMVECGVNRISFGAQSFENAETAASGRLHTAAQTVASLDEVRAAGIANLSVDLIAGLPHQTRDSFRRSLETLVALEVPHASVYMLEVDEDSRLGRELLAGGSKYRASHVPDDDTIAAMYEEACELLPAAGLSQYEISNFARDGYVSRHNLRYWQRRPYLGFGMDAHSMLRTAVGEAVRFANADTLEAYDRGELADTPRILTAREETEEAFFLGLRCAGGVRLSTLEQEFGWAAIAEFREAIAQLIADGLLARDDGRIALTPRGRMLSNEVFSRFLLEEPVLA